MSRPKHDVVPERGDRPEVRRLLINLRSGLPRLRIVFTKCNGPGHREDGVARFYRQSADVFELQAMTEEMVAALQDVMPKRKLHPRFLQIVREGTGRTLRREDHLQWAKATRPILEAFFHARFFVEMAIRYGERLEAPPEPSPGGWAALICLYGLD